MKESNDLFFKLQNMPEFFYLEDYELNTVSLEQEMMHNNGGLWLETLNQGDVNGQEHLARKFVPYFSQYDSFGIRELARKFPKINGPCAMSVASDDELLEHMSIGYQVAHFHYILGKKHYPSFPDNCCGNSATNVTLSLMSFGYANATFAHSIKDHAYVLLPFVNEKSGSKGSILIDPTSDQLWNGKDKRNSIFIKLGDNWTYRTHWNSGNNLFPDEVFSIEEMKTMSKSYEKTHLVPLRNICAYFKTAFNNPIKIKNISVENV